MKDSQTLKPAFQEACKFLVDVIKGGTVEEQSDQVRASISVLSAYSRLKAVENNESVIGLTVVRSMASDTKELKAMIQRTLPEYVK